MPGLALLAVVGLAALATLCMAGGEMDLVTKPGYKTASIKNNLQHPGDVFYLGSTVTGLRTASDSAGYGYDKATPFATLEYAVNKCTADHGDTIIVLPGHNEGGDAVIADIDIAGVTIIGTGKGALRPRFDFDNAASTIDIGANNVTIYNCTFLPSAASVLIALDVESGKTNFRLENCEFLEAETAGDEFVVTVKLVSGNNDSVIRGNTFRTEDAAGACTSAILTAAACARVRIEQNLFRGNWSTAAIKGTAADPNIYIARNDMKVKDGEPGIELHSSTTGHIIENKIESTGLGADAMIVAAGCAWFDNTGVTADGAEAQPIGRGVTEDAFGASQTSGTGTDWYVDSVNGASGNAGTSWDDAVDKIDTAINLCTTALGDTIHVAQNHAETVAGAAAINVDLNDVRIIGYGTGNARPTLTFDTTTDTMAVSGTNVLIENMRFISDVADMAVALNVAATADGLVVRGCEFRDGAANKEMLVAIGIATTVTDVLVEKCAFYTTATGDCTDAILFAGTTSRVRIEDCIFMGDWSSGCVDHSAGKATDIVLRNNICNNIDATAGLCFNLEATSTGLVIGNRCHGGKTSTDPIVAAACMQADNISTQVEGIQAAGKYGNRCDRGESNIAQGGQLSLFTIAGGRVIVNGIVGEVTTTDIQGQANAMKLSINPTAGSTSDICATLDINGDLIGTLYGVVGDPALALAEYGCMTANPLVIDAGVIEQTCAASSTGKITWTVYWEPFDAGATLVAA